ncbi:hypothetical protein VVD49_01610 [Uliginosibacterium sp. H3]|uniref:Uncharacterized protein n=1 Tax=Uliginosibacterium silvisoli TaxID=3114758 RepID=A0ABU6JZ00_9RHOO|nr:hypothetical protein [Uliginosibacterium sp. H3]
MNHLLRLTCISVFSLFPLSVLVGGCGGGAGGGLPSDSSITAQSRLQAAALVSSSSSSRTTQATQASGVMTLSASSPLAGETVTLGTSDFEAAFLSCAQGWDVNSWGGAQFSVSRVSPGASGSGAQGFKLISKGSGGDAHLVYRFNPAAGKTYRANLRVKLDAGASAILAIRQNNAPFVNFATTSIVGTGGWASVVLEGVFGTNDSGAFRIQLSQPNQQIAIDSFQLREMPKPVLDVIGASDFEAPFSSVATGWAVNSWFGAQATASRMSSGTAVGAGAQLFAVQSKGSGGNAELYYAAPFVQGKVYRARMKALLNNGVRAVIFFRQDAFPYTVYASKLLEGNGGWQEVFVEGAYLANTSGSVRVSLDQAGQQIGIDDFQVGEVLVNPLMPSLGEKVSPLLFGMHVNRLGTHAAWPALNQRVVRMHDTGTLWRDIQPDSNAVDFTNNAAIKRLDMYLAYVQRNDPAASVLFTFSGVPQWLATDPNSPGEYGPGSSSPPRDMASWRSFVRQMAIHYKGRIKYWEVWNEANYFGFWNGTPEQMAVMTHIAYQELKSADPANVVVAANMDLAALDRYLSGGAKDFIDAVSFHFYFDDQPEKVAAQAAGVRQIMEAHGISQLPIWNTEGAPDCNVSSKPCQAAMPMDRIAELLVRGFASMAAAGVSNFNYYVMEGLAPQTALLASDWTTVTPVGKAYSAAARWLANGQIETAYCLPEGICMVSVVGRGWLVWHRLAAATVNLPFTPSAVEYIDGTRGAAVTGATVTATSRPVMYLK